MLTINWSGTNPVIFKFAGKCGGTAYFEGSSHAQIAAGIINPNERMFGCYVYGESYEMTGRKEFPLPECIDCLCTFQERIYEKDFVLKRSR